MEEFLTDYRASLLRKCKALMKVLAGFFLLIFFLDEDALVKVPMIALDAVADKSAQ